MGAGEVLYASMYFLQHLALNADLPQYRFQKGTICDGEVCFYTLLSVGASAPDPCVHPYFE